MSVPVRAANAAPSSALAVCAMVLVMNKPTLEPTAFEPADDAAEARAIADAEAQVTAGKVISHESVRRWLKSWGQATELPPPERGE